MSLKKYIAHFDLDSFFVSVEVLNNPELKGLPVVVGGSKERGVVAACSYEARKYGVHSAMPMRRAFQLCPDAVLVRGTRGEYSRYSKWVTDIIAAKAPLFQKASIDEFYIDLTGMDKYFDPLQWTINLRKEIIEQTKLPISFGLAPNKIVAKIATDEAKPNGYLYIQHGKEKDFLAPLMVNKIPGVGGHTHEVLKQMGITYIGNIYKKTKEELEENFGSWGVELWYKAQGIHEGTVNPWHEAKSISTENTFETNLVQQEDMIKEIVRMAEKVAFELRQDKKLCGCVAVKIRYPDFETASKQIAVKNTNRDDEIIPVALELFKRLYKKGNTVRLLGVRLSNFSNMIIQGNLFNNAEKSGNLYKAIDDVKTKWGSNFLSKASAAKSGGKIFFKK